MLTELQLAMLAGARAIENSRYGKDGVAYAYDIFGDCQRIYYTKAVEILRESALKEHLNEKDNL